MTSHTGGGNAAYGKGGSARLSRRRVLGGPAAASGGAALAVGTGAGTARAHGGVRTYVLVHGTHSAGFFWTAIGREPALRGHRVVMVDQPLHGTEKFVPKPIRRRTCGRWRRSPRRWPRSRWTTSSAG